MLFEPYTSPAATRAVESAQQERESFWKGCISQQVPTSLDRLLELTSSDSADTRRIGIAGLIEVHCSPESLPRIRPALLNELRGDDIRAKRWILARDVPGLRSLPGYTETLIECLEAGDSELSELAIYAINLDPEAPILPLLVRLRRNWWERFLPARPVARSVTERRLLAKALRVAVSQYELAMQSQIDIREHVDSQIVQLAMQRYIGERNAIRQALRKLRWSWRDDDPLVRIELAYCYGLSLSRPTAPIRDLAAGLQSGDVAVRLNAVTCLATMAKAWHATSLLAAPLFDAFCDPDPEIWKVAQEALGNCDRALIPLLRSAFSGATQEIRLRCAEFVCNQHKYYEFRSQVTALLPLMRAEACDAAFRYVITDESPLDPAIEECAFLMTAKSESEIVAAGLWGLCRLAEAQAIRRPPAEILHRATSLLNSGDSVRASAYSLIAVVEPDPEKVLALANQGLFDSDDFVTRRCLVALEDLVNRVDLTSAIPGLMVIVRKREYELKSACKILIKMGSRAQASVPLLNSELRSDGSNADLEIADAIFQITQDHKVLLTQARIALRTADETWIRSIACDKLHSLGSNAQEALEELLAALDSSDGELQWAATDALGAICTAETVPVLIKAIGHRNGIVVKSALSYLVEMGEIAVHSLIAALGSANAERVELIVDVLGKIGDAASASVPEIRRFLSSDNQAVADWSAIAIGKLAADATVVPRLRAILKREVGPHILAEAMDALRKIGTPAVVAIPELKHVAETHTLDDVRETAFDVIQSVTT